MLALSCIMDTIKSHLTQYDDKLDNLILKYSYTTKNDIRRHNIYNQNIKLSLHKIWILTPKLKIIKKSSTLKKNDIEYCLFTLALNNHDHQIKQFHELIKRIETYLTEKLNSDELLSLKSCIRSDEDNIDTITFSIPIKHQIGIYNTDHSSTTLDNINHGDYLIMYLELNTVWENTEKYGMNWQILQMKVYPEFDFKACLFDDPIPINNHIPKPPPLNIPPPPMIKPINTTKNKPGKPVEPEGGFIPSVEQLLTARNTLKSVNPPKPVNKTNNLKKKKVINKIVNKKI